MLIIKRSLILGFVILPVFLTGIAAGFYGTRLAGAFEGPEGTAGSGTGAISSDSSNNLAVGTTTVLSDTRLFILGSNSADDKFAIQLKNKEGRPLFLLRNDGRVVMGPFPVGGPPSFPSASTLLVRGLIETVSSTNPDLGGGIRFPDGTTQTTAGATTLSAANVSQGTFGANTSGGNYSFPDKLGINKSNPEAQLEVRGGLAVTSDVNNSYLSGETEGLGFLYSTSTRIGTIFVTIPTGINEYRDLRIDARTIDLRAGQPSGLSVGSSLFIASSTAAIGARVGIGTTNPGQALDIANGGIRLTSSIDLLGVSPVSGQRGIQFRGRSSGDRTIASIIPNGSVGLTPAGLEVFGTDYTADSTNYERFMIRSQGTSNTTYKLATEAGGTGTVRPLQITTGSNIGLNIDTSGNIGINIAAPAAALHVSGEARITGISSDGSGKAVCVKSDGNLGTCSTTVGATGLCTCN